MMIKENCFAFRTVTKKKDGVTWEENKCDCLNDFYCDGCPFFKEADTLEMYRFKIHQTTGVGYKLKNEC